MIGEKGGSVRGGGGGGGAGSITSRLDPGQCWGALRAWSGATMCTDSRRSHPIQLGGLCQHGVFSLFSLTKVQSFACNLRPASAPPLLLTSTHPCFGGSAKISEWLYDHPFLPKILVLPLPFNKTSIFYCI